MQLLTRLQNSHAADCTSIDAPILLPVYLYGMGSLFIQVPTKYNARATSVQVLNKLGEICTKCNRKICILKMCLQFRLS